MAPAELSVMYNASKPTDWARSDAVAAALPAVCMIDTACRSAADVAAWEMRQIPYEHPKGYDPVTLLATRQEKNLTLTPTTRRLLEYLLRASPRVVARSELEHLLWGEQVPEDDVLHRAATPGA